MGYDAELRRTGRTTRLVDQLVQDFFTTGRAVVLDHWWHGKQDMGEVQSKEYILNVFLRRLKFEHDIEPRKHLKVDPKTGIVELKK